MTKEAVEPSTRHSACRRLARGVLQRLTLKRMAAEQFRALLTTAVTFAKVARLASGKAQQRHHRRMVQPQTWFACRIAGEVVL
jgi:hypothetical protein